MQIESRQEDAFVYLRGRIDISKISRLKETFHSILDDESLKRVILDFDRVEMIDSSGLGQILLLRKNLDKQGRKLKIVNVTSDYVQRMFVMMHLDKVIDIEGL